jgi:hypothetical protein
MYKPFKNLQGKTDIVDLTFSVGDSISSFTISIEQRQLELVTQYRGLKINTSCLVYLVCTPKNMI